VTNTLAYDDRETITTLKRFTEQVPEKISILVLNIQFNVNERKAPGGI
jgi:hypothetical protein